MVVLCQLAAPSMVSLPGDGLAAQKEDMAPTPGSVHSIAGSVLKLEMLHQAANLEKKLCFACVSL